VHVRLEFLADLWRIDRVGLSSARRGTTRVIAPSVLTDISADPDTMALARVVQPDARYLMTYPGDWFRIGFDTPEPRAAQGALYTYMLAAQGYYTEWVRNDWLRNATPVKFEPGDAALSAAYARWRTRQPGFEAQFYANRVQGRQP
jgi:hypothetical protein